MNDRLLKRLGRKGKEVDPLVSVIEHLRRLLNARSGTSVCAPDYGLPDLTEIIHQFPEGVHFVQQAIRDVILKYEPRLSHVALRFIPDDEALTLKFEIAARLKDDPDRKLVLHTEMGPSGRVRIRR